MPPPAVGEAREDTGDHLGAVQEPAINMKLSMAKTRKTKTKKVKVMMPQRTKVPRAMPMLDKAAAEYARLIADPCNAKLVNTIWPGANGSFVSRFETDFIFRAGATETAGILVYVPGTNSCYVNATTLTNDTTATLIGVDNVSFPPPGNAFLSAAGSIRAVASCMQVTFPGTELNRSGIVSLGVTNFGAITTNVATAAGGGNVNTNASSIRTLCQHVERMPQEMAEITWFPNSGDQAPFELSQQGANVQLDDAASFNCIVMSATGFPVSTGVRVRIVTVLEWTPKTGQGLVATAEVPTSSNTLNDVLRTLFASKGTHWFINAYKKAAPYARAIGSVINYGAKTLGPALMAL